MRSANPKAYQQRARIKCWNSAMSNTVGTDFRRCELLDLGILRFARRIGVGPEFEASLRLFRLPAPGLALNLLVRTLEEQVGKDPMVLR